MDFTYWADNASASNSSSWGATINGNDVTGQWSTASVDDELIFLCATTS